MIISYSLLYQFCLKIFVKILYFYFCFEDLCEDSLLLLLFEDLCEDSDAKMRIIELVDAVKHKKKLLQILHERTGVSDKASGRRMSSARRYAKTVGRINFILMLNYFKSKQCS